MTAKYSALLKLNLGEKKTVTITVEEPLEDIITRIYKDTNKG